MRAAWKTCWRKGGGGRGEGRRAAGKTCWRKGGGRGGRGEGLLVFEFFVFCIGDVTEVLAGYVHDGCGGYSFDGDDDAEVFLDAFHYTHHACVKPFGDAGFHAWLAGEV